MTSTVRVVCRPEVGIGFGLAGLVTVEAHSAEEGAERIAALANAPEVGIILAQQDFYDAISATTRRSLGRTPVPIVIPFPPPSSSGDVAAVEAYLVEILRQAIGYRVRLR